jgi:YbbR domain-containing protein
MLLALMRWLNKNFGTLLLSFVLSVVVWTSAVMASDPNRERSFPKVSLEIIGKNEDMLIVNNIPSQVTVILFAPESNLAQYDKNSSLLRATLDVTGLESGTYTLPINVTYVLQPARLLGVEPQLLDITLDRLVTRIDPVHVEIVGKPVRGYQTGVPVLDISRVTISGPATLIDKVEDVRAILDISGKSETMESSIPLQVLDVNGTVMDGVEISPRTVRVKQPITLLGGYRNEVVRIITMGQVASGYRLTSIFASPANVMLFSSDPQLVDNLPGYVETKPLELSNATGDMEVWLPLNLPPGISVVGDQNVLAQVSIAAIESSMTIQIPLEVIGLSPGFSVEGVPKVVDVILSGSLPALDALQKGDIRVVLDITDKEAGTYLIKPEVQILSKDIHRQSVTPDIVEVTLQVQSPTTKIGSPTPVATPPDGTPFPAP